MIFFLEIVDSSRQQGGMKQMEQIQSGRLLQQIQIYSLKKFVSQ